MIDLIKDHSPYWVCFLLLTIGLYGMILKTNLMKKVIGLTIFQASIVLLFIAAAYKEGGTVPVYDAQFPADNPDLYVNPLPHALMLTAIVVGVAIIGVALSLLIRIFEAYGTLDEKPLHEEMKK